MKTAPDSAVRGKGRFAFTLVELLVVIAIMAILAALLLPAISQSKVRAQTIACLDNVKQLQLGFHLYTGENNDFLPPNNFVYDNSVGQPFPGNVGPSWCTNVAPFDPNPASIQNGLLFQYNNSVAIYHCPADRSTILTSGGVALSQTRLRSYNMSQSVNGLNYVGNAAQFFPHYSKFTDIKTPSPTGLIVFIDEHEDTILDDQFGIPVNVDADAKEYGNWWDMPANRHGQGCNFSFADGHTEHWKWKIPKVVNVPRVNEQPVGDAEWDDYNRMQSGFLQSFD